MQSTTVRAVDSRRAEADARAVDLVNAYATCDPADPSRALLRDEAIAAWLPMAGRLARRYSQRPEALEDLTQTAVV